MQFAPAPNMGLIVALYLLFWLAVLAALIYTVRTALSNQRRAAVAQEQMVELLREQNSLIRQGAVKP